MKKMLLVFLFLLCLPLSALALEGDMGKSILTLPGLVKSPYDAYPALGVYTEIDAEQDEDGNYETTIRIVHRCFGDSSSQSFPAAEDVEIEVIAMDGLQLLSGVGSFRFEEIPYGETAAVQVSVRYVPEDDAPTEKPDPRLLVYVDSANMGSAKYAAHFEATGEATAYLLGWDCDTGTPDAIQSDLAMMEELFSRSYYNGKPVSIVSEYEYPDFWEIFSQFVECPQTDSDITYLYINTHGAQEGGFVPTYLPAFKARTPNAEPVKIFSKTYIDQDIVSYERLLAYPNHMPGKVVILFDICFAGYAIGDADLREVDATRHTILTAVDSENLSGAYDNLFASYGWFTHDLYEYANTIDDRSVTTGDAYERLNANKIWTPKGSLLPQIYGRAENSLFCFNPYYWEMGCPLKIVNETLDITPPDNVEASIKAALGPELLAEMHAKGHSLYVNHGYANNRFIQVQFDSPSDQLYDDVDHDLMKRIYLAALHADVFGLSDASIETLSGFSFSYNNQHSYPEMYVDYCEKPFGGVALMLTPN